MKASFANAKIYIVDTKKLRFAEGADYARDWSKAAPGRGILPRDEENYLTMSHMNRIWSCMANQRIIQEWALI